MGDVATIPLFFRRVPRKLQFEEILQLSKQEGKIRFRKVQVRVKSLIDLRLTTYGGVMGYGWIIACVISWGVQVGF